VYKGLTAVELVNDPGVCVVVWLLEFEAISVTTFCGTGERLSKVGIVEKLDTGRVVWLLGFVFKFV